MTPSRDITRLLEIMAALRTPGSGCPWDLEQNFATIAPYTIEEAYEVADAIARGDLDDLREELGDLLLQVVFHARMAEEQQAFAEAFGALPSRSSLESWVASEFPEQAAFSAGVRYARGPVPVVGFDSVLADFNTGLEAMVAGGATPQEVLAQLQRNGEEVLTQ